MRARGFALRNQFADALAGLVSREEAMDMPAEQAEEYQVVEDNGLISKDQVEAINKLAAEKDANMGKFCEYFQIGAIEGLPANKYDQAIQMLQAKGAKRETA